jgi:Na+/H+ antiporter NhaA
LAVFFLFVGLEIERAMLDGQLVFGTGFDCVTMPGGTARVRTHV